MAKKKRNPQDATRRNVRAANKKIKALESRVEYLESRVRVDLKLEQRIYSLEQRMEGSLAQDFATAQRSLGYVSSTAPQHRVIVDRKP